jgi:[acyl-carrier-protein] S-malonyltransferase
MGRDLFAASAAARRTFEEADEVLGFALSRLCHEGPEDALTATSNAQPAILVHSIAVLRTIEERSAGVAYAAGHSLGEFTAYVAAGALPFADAVRTVRRRGELMQQSGAARPGTMAAILGLEEGAALEVCERASTAGAVCVPANYNAPGQIVISGDVRAVEAALVLAKEAGARRAVRLNVSGAFHSPLMEEAEAGLAAQLETVAMSDPGYPVVSNVTAQPVTSAADASRLLVRQLTSPVRWTDSVRTMLGLGVTTFLEIGPGSVLTGLLRRIDREARARTVGTAEEAAAFAV